MSATGGKLASGGEGFYFLSVPVTGDFTLVARVSSVSALTYSSSQQFRIGLIAYDTSTTSNNVFANVGVVTDSTGTANWIPFDAYRLTTASTTVNKAAYTANQVGYGAGIYLKLVRVGEVYSSYVAPVPTGGAAPTYVQVGQNRTMVTTGVNPMAVGLMMATSAASTIQFDEVTLTKP